MQSNPVVPGGDPGTWFATAYAFFNPNHPSQSVPLAYPPVLFPLLGVTARLAGGPVAGAQVFAPVLYFVVGLSIFYLATRMLRSRLVALTVTSFVVLDPQLIQMLFWGAYPNLLGFVFLFMALAGIVVMGQGAVSRGALMFWIFALLAVLTHSLTGLLLAGTMVMVLLLTWPLPVRRSNDGSPLAEQGSADVPGNIRRGLFFSRGGSIGFVLFAVLVGGYYVVTALAQVPHPDYFVSNPLAFRVVGLGGFFHSLFPGFNLLSLIVVDLLAVSIIAILLLYSILFLYRPAWLTTPTIVLLSSGIIIALTPVVGWMFRIVSDYTRFGFFLIVPVALSFGYLIDRGWVSHQRNPPTSPPSAASPTSPLVKRWLYRTRHPRRAVTFAIVSIVVGLFIVGGITAPALGRLETTFTKVGHDQNFINALNTIDRSGVPGSILTVPGADKWARAISERNAYAPYTQATYLFYQSQILDSDLSYYALMSHYAITNGLVSATVRGITSGNVNGTPGYGVYVVGAYHPVLQVAGADLGVEMVNAVTGATYSARMNPLPTILLPSTPGSPLEIEFNGTGVQVELFVTPTPGDPQLAIVFDAIATGADSVAALNIPLVPAVYTSAAVALTVAGQFNWRTWSSTGVQGPLTVGNVTPDSALTSTGGTQSPNAGANLSFRSPTVAGARVIGGQLTLWTPTASTLDNVLPSVLDTPQIWTELGVRFILMKNATYGPAQTVSSAGEIPYLETEFGATSVYTNPEWTVLEIPADE
ncbi:MAG: hypothetical protein WB984_01585 [Thermoplasmata archaeon]